MSYKNTFGNTIIDRKERENRYHMLPGLSDTDFVVELFTK